MSQPGRETTNSPPPPLRKVSFGKATTEIDVSESFVAFIDKPSL